ncbi:hypothetical protein J4448_03010 [Candidatus Woesearchaeota archaeon]|nr:hypothetical protein [Candidatus Woesearchaeota archaeon]
MSNFFAHYVFSFPSERSATVSLKTYGSKILGNSCSSKTAEVIKMVYTKVDLDAEQVLIGSLLGDGGLQLRGKAINANFRIQHSLKQKKYLEYKAKYLDCFRPKTLEFKVFDSRTNKVYYHIILLTKTHPVLTSYFKIFYKNNKKCIAKETLQKVGPLALAIWYCDDGSFGYINQNAKIATYVSYEENKILVDFLKEKFDINCTINRDYKRYYLYFSVQQIKKFLNLIKDYIPKCMNYKLGPFAEENNKRLNEENLKRRQKDKIRYYKYMANPIRHELIKKQHQINHQRRMQNPEYRKRYNEYHKNWRKQKQSNLSR